MTAISRALAALLSLAMILLVGSAAAGRAQEPASAAPGVLLSPGDLEQLVAPIALYPDPLISLILPASTVPTDVVLANRYLQDGGDPAGIDAQNWDESVKGLARYPDVLRMMDENLDWTNQLGAAVLAQQDDVMRAIQAMRAKARALGNLETTGQQQVLSDDGAIEIVPANPQTIYVPVYDPDVIYVQSAPLVTFSIGFAVGPWLGWGCDWHRYGLYRGGFYRPGYGWRYVRQPASIWRPNPHKPRPNPPYHPGRPGKPGKLPGWRPPPHGGKPAPGRPGGKPGPGHPGKPSNGRPGPGRPGAGKPGTPSAPPSHRPGGPGNPPAPGRPGIHPPAGKQPGAVKPSPGRPQPPSNRPSRPPALPANRPDFDRDRLNSKRPEQRPSASPHVRPAPPRASSNRPAPQAQKSGSGRSGSPRSGPSPSRSDQKK